MLYVRPLQFTLNSSGVGSLDFQLENAAVIWDVQMISVQALNPKINAICRISVDGFFACATSAGGGDTAQGPPDIYLSPSQKLTVSYSAGNANDTIIVTLFYVELDRYGALQ